MAKNSTRARTAVDGLTIACKLPSGLRIQLPDDGIDLLLHGANSAYAVAGHGMTRGVKAEQWEVVKARFAEAKWLVNEFVFAMTSPESAADKAEEREEVKAGFEPIDPDKLPKGIESSEVPR